ncbi:hypothetical protein WJX74_005736 [Apatococcus lobatus]|uniref:FACT complex subunit SSRP1 n=1 Tax=Apatococcus lobatus TaxID=904363 RepID=A0AAW1SF27_9CHLO
MKLVGQNQDFRIQYDSLHRLFLLPRPNSSQTIVAISVDPPIRKGNTYYPFIICQFSNDEERTLELDISDEALKAKNDASSGRPTEKTMEGTLPDVFAKALRGLATAKLTKPGSFQTSDGSGCAVRASFKADDGYLYPLEKAFFYVGKPPMLLVYEEQDSVEFLRQGGGVLAASAKTFDLAVRSSETEYLFRGIAKSEWSNLFEFIEAKRMRIENIKEAKMGPGGPGINQALDLDLGDDIDTGIARMQANEDEEGSEEDEDFEAGAAEQQEAEDEGDESGSDASGDAEMIDEDDAPRKKVSSAADKPAKKPAKPREKKEKPAVDGAAKPKARRAKKDKNAPKGALSAFMFFSNATREQVKSENPGMPVTGVARILGEKWKQLSNADREPFNEQAKADKVRATQQKAEYAEQKKAEASQAGADADESADIMSE